MGTLFSEAFSWLVAKIYGAVQWVIDWLPAWMIAMVPLVVIRAAWALGLGYAVYSGVDVLLSLVKAQVIGNLGGIPIRVIQIFGLLRADDALNLIFSAFAARQIMDGFINGSKKVMEVRSTGDGLSNG